MEKVVPMLCVSDVAATIAWYTRLGFAIKQRHPEAGEMGEIEFAFLSMGGVELMVQPRGDRPMDSVALWFYTDRIDEMYAALRRQTATQFLEELYEPFYGGRQFSVADANGIEIVFYSPAAT